MAPTRITTAGGGPYHPNRRGHCQTLKISRRGQTGSKRKRKVLAAWLRNDQPPEILHANGIALLVGKHLTSLTSLTSSHVAKSLEFRKRREKAALLIRSLEHKERCVQKERRTVSCGKPVSVKRSLAAQLVTIVHYHSLRKLGVVLIELSLRQSCVRFCYVID